MSQRRLATASVILAFAAALQFGFAAPSLFDTGHAWAKSDNGNGGGNSGGKGGGSGNGGGNGNSGGKGNSGGSGNSGGNGNGAGNSGGNGSGNGNGSANANPAATQKSNNGKKSIADFSGTVAAATTEVPAASNANAAGNGELNRAIAHEIVVANAGDTLPEFAASNGFGVLSQQKLGSLGISVTRLSPPATMSLVEARARLASAYPGASIDFNHVYKPQASMTLPAPDFARKLIGWNTLLPECGGEPVQIGMLDTVADTKRPILSGASITQQVFLDSPDSLLAMPDHGSIVAAILAGQQNFGLLPHAALSIAGIFTLDQDGAPIASATAFVSGLDWLAGQGVKTINTSLSGPYNALMELAVGAAASHGIRIVAAVGNDGFADVARYPAAFPGVIGVTAVDADRQAFAKANKGTFVAFAAPGVDLWLPAPMGSKNGGANGTYVSGTSFAAPFVAAALAANGNDLDSLTNAAVDLGATGRDATFGYGLVQASNTCPAAIR